MGAPEPAGWATGSWLQDQLVRGHRGDPWHGWSVARILEGVHAAGAAARPLHGAHSIWEIVLHMTGWTREAARRIEGGSPAEPADGDWPGVGDPTPERWIAALDDLGRAHAELERALAALPEADWHQLPSAPRDPSIGTGVTPAQLVNGVVQHDAYHAGQIALLKKGLQR